MKAKIIYLILLFFSSLIFIHCAQKEATYDSNSSDTGIGGSLNRFTIIDSFLYVLDQTHVESYLIDGENLEFAGRTEVDENIETIFPFDSLLLIGGQAGMYICKRGINGNIEVISSYEHIMSCDPVITDGEYAYVTLSAGCSSQANQLDILNISDPYNPLILRTYPMDNPKGLALDKSLLFICDYYSGLKVFDRSDPVNIVLLQTIGDINPVDVIAYNSLLFVMTDFGIHQYDYSKQDTIIQLSSILLN